eukprot:SAG22_NODE_14_length_33165_cov_13.196698_7_plen_189_part_00
MRSRLDPELFFQALGATGEALFGVRTVHMRPAIHSFCGSLLALSLSSPRGSLGRESSVLQVALSPAWPSAGAQMLLPNQADRRQPLPGRSRRYTGRCRLGFGPDHLAVERGHLPGQSVAKYCAAAKERGRGALVVANGRGKQVIMTMGATKVAVDSYLLILKRHDCGHPQAVITCQRAGVPGYFTARL